MMKQKCLELRAAIVSAASAVGKKESDGPLGSCFDLRDDSDRFGAKTWEGAESERETQYFITANFY